MVFTVNNPPSLLRAAPDSLVFTYQPGAATPPTQAVVVTAANGSATPSFTAVALSARGQPAEVQYAGSAPGFISGALQVNALIPETAPSGSAIQVVLTIGDASSQGVATIAIQ